MSYNPIFWFPDHKNAAFLDNFPIGRHLGCQPATSLVGAQFLPQQVSHLPASAGLWLGRLCTRYLVKKMSTLTPIHQPKIYNFNQHLSNFHLSTAQVCNPKVWHLLLLPDLQVQARQPGFQVHRTAKATSTCGERWSRPWVYVSFLWWIGSQTQWSV